MTEYSPVWPHGPLQAAFPDVFFVVGTNKTHHAGVDLQTSRTMVVVRTGEALTLINTVRLDDAGLRELDALGEVRHVVRLGAFHGRDDPFYCDRYGAELWALPAAEHADGRRARGAHPATVSFVEPPANPSRSVGAPPGSATCSALS